MNISRLLMLNALFFVACKNAQTMELHKRKAEQTLNHQSPQSIQEMSCKEMFAELRDHPWLITPSKKLLQATLVQKRRLEEKAAFAKLSDFEKAYHLLGSSPEFKDCSLYDDSKDSLFKLCLEKLLLKLDEELNTLLHYAAQQNNIEYAKRFIRMGLAINQKNSDGKTPLALAQEAGNIEVCTLLQANENLLSLGIYTNDEDLKTLKIALQAKACINVRNQDGYTPLLKATYGLGADSRIELIAKLLEAGALVNVKNDMGATPLHNAVYCGSVETVKLLLKTGAGASVNTQEKSTKDTPLHNLLMGSYAQKHRKTLTQLLLDAHADTTIKNYWGKTALDLTREYGDADIAALLEGEPQ